MFKIYTTFSYIKQSKLLYTSRKYHTHKSVLTLFRQQSHTFNKSNSIKIDPTGSCPFKGPYTSVLYTTGDFLFKNSVVNKTLAT